LREERGEEGGNEKGGTQRHKGREWVQRRRRD
jgi:hypothetical protein